MTSVALRLALAAAALALALAAVLHFQGYRSGREALLRSVEPALSPERATGVLPRLHREPDLAQARAQAARALLAEALAGRAADLEGAALEAELGRLALARELALEAAAAQPSNATALMGIGAATYLSWSIGRDRRLFSEAPAWEAPLERAIELAPGNPEPARFLAMAYLELWTVLSPRKQEVTRRMLTRGFRDPGTFDRLIEGWLAVVPSLEEALAVMPDLPFAWDRLRKRYAARRDWSAYDRVSRGWHNALEADFERRLQTSSELLEKGYAGAARAVLLSVAGDAPVDGRYYPVLGQVMRLLPPGPVGERAAETLASWLESCLDLFLLRECPLPPEAIGRLAGLTGERPPVASGLAALAADDLVAAERIERQSTDLWTPDWAPYWIAKARTLTGRGDLAAARQALELVHPSWHPRPLYQRQRRRLAEAAGDLAEATAATTALAAAGRPWWPAAAWQQRAERWRLELSADRPWVGPRIEIDAPSAPEAAAEVFWDGSWIAILALAGQTSHTFPLAVDAGLHLLELEPLGRGRWRPGEVELFPPGAAEAGPG